MNDKRGLSIFLVMILMGFLTYLAFADIISEGYTPINGTPNNVLLEVSPIAGANISGNINLTAVVNDTASILNVSFMWQLVSTNVFSKNITYSNITEVKGYANQTRFGNVSGGSYNFNTSSLNTTTGLADGIYNLTLFLCNGSISDNAIVGTTCWTNSTFSRTTITVDNTIPAVAPVALPPGQDLFIVSTYNVTFNVSIKDLTISTAAVTAAPGLVTFHFNNATGNGFNTTPVNQSGGWVINYNVSSLKSGTHTIKVFVNDTARTGAGATNSNITQTITFTINNPHNVTWDPSYTGTTYSGSPSGYANFTVISYNYTFNVSVKNASVKPAGALPSMQVVFQFNNASGNDFNVSVTTAYVGQYYNFSYNISSLHSGLHRVTTYVNDTMGNVNSTEFITFTVNNPHNVTWDGAYSSTAPAYHGSPQRQNYSYNNGTVYFNVSIFNASVKAPDSMPPIQAVIFMFDNATGNDFNVTNSSAAVSGRYWNVSYVNVSALVEGNHTVTIFVNDSMGNVNTTEKIHFFVDRTAPSVTVSCSPSAATVGDTVTCSCSATETAGNSSGIKTSARFSGSGSASESTTASGTSGNSQTCYAEDYSGNSGTATGSWTVSAASSGGSGNSGGGGGTPTGVTGQFAKEVWTSINAGETAKVEVTNGAIGVTEVSFSVADTTYGAWLKVEKKDSLPSDVQSFSGKVYKNVEITESNIKKALTGTAKIEFKVTKVWLSENGLGKTDLAMHRYADSKWSELKTTVGEDDGTYQYYSAETPGFSYFVIGQKSGAVAGPAKEAAAEKVAGEKAAAGEEAAAAGEEVVAGESQGIWTWVIVVLVIIGLVAIAFWLKKRA